MIKLKFCFIKLFVIYKTYANNSENSFVYCSFKKIIQFIFLSFYLIYLFVQQKIIIIEN